MNLDTEKQTSVSNNSNNDKIAD